MKTIKPNLSISLKRRLFGMKLTDGLLYRVVLYALLIIIGFVYVYPLLHMLSYSLKSLADLLDPTINVLPSSLYLENFSNALLVLNYVPLFFESLTVTLIPAILQTIVASLIGYGFARFQFPLKKLWFALLLATYLIPPQVTMIPRYVLFFNIGILETIFSIIIPATFGQGVSSAIFVLIFYQFYLMVPKFSFVWYWNETYIARLFLGSGGETLLIRLYNFVSAYNAILGGGSNVANEAIRMAATLLIIAPLIVAYFILQRLFIEGIDRSGITGE